SSTSARRAKVAPGWGFCTRMSRRKWTSPARSTSTTISV
ncbi:hypothetical protein AZZ62_004818, partial [Klebsiella variicola]